MNCMEARRMVTPFVKKELSEKDTEEFLRHVEQCSDCMDELDTYYTVYHALNLLDSGAHHEYDFRKMLAEDVRQAKRRLLKKRVFLWLRAALYLLTESLLLLTVIAGLRFRAGQDGLLRHMLDRVQLVWEEQETETPGESEAETWALSETEALSAGGTETGVLPETEALSAGGTETGVSPETEALSVGETGTAAAPEASSEQLQQSGE